MRLNSKPSSTVLHSVYQSSKVFNGSAFDSELSTQNSELALDYLTPAEFEAQWREQQRRVMVS
jgi:hypothetical protein